MKALTIYKASAGSGKTFTLATEYIKLLISNPQSYKNILAVTFTNKATEEMKMRILSQLYGLWKKLHDSSPYMQKITTETEYSEDFISKRAGEALHLLLHNYSYFQVETIDAFFQTVLRNLARELELNANLRIELNDNQIEEHAVDQLIEHLQATDFLLLWLMRFIMENISDNKGWNIIGQIKSFGKNIFKDHYKNNRDTLNKKLEQDDVFDTYIHTLHEIKDNAAKRMKDIAEAFFAELEADGFTIDDLQYKQAGVAGFFIKLRNGQLDESIVGKRVADCNGDVTKWYAKNHPQANAIHSLAETSLMPMLHYAIEERPQQWRRYKSADLILRHAHQLRLLQYIEKEVRELNDNANRFLLSDTQLLLHELINDNDTPFVFEKIGTRISHIMIDEFQDTSAIQWRNFKILLQECMSHENSSNLIVGDVKQSIYRWRDGDWRLLHNISNEFSDKQDMLKTVPLQNNYRSAPNIVHFNNIFFSLAADYEYQQLYDDDSKQAQLIKEAYADICQNAMATDATNGLIDIKLFGKDDYQNNVLEETAKTIKMLIANNVSPQQIAILVRYNKHIPIIANYLTTNTDVTVVSDEAFRLDASTTVNIIIEILRLLIHPDDRLCKATIAKTYQRTILKNSITDDELLANQHIDTFLPEAFTAHTEELLKLPLYELVEQIYRIFELTKLSEQNAYLCAFYDELIEYINNNATDINTFIKEWEDNLSRKTIKSDEVDGIRIVSIHRSKGLEYDHVIIPFCDWEPEKQNNNIIWRQPTTAPYNQMPIVPIDYSRNNMMGTIFEQDYLEEHMQNSVDNLNLLYVAFTRARKNLFVIGKRDTKNTRSTLLQEILPYVAEKLNGAIWEGDSEKEMALHFLYGTLENHHQDKNKKSDNVFHKETKELEIKINTYKNKTEFRQSNQSREFTKTTEPQENHEYIKLGNILHQIFSKIRTTDDIEAALQQLELEGVLYDKYLTTEKIQNMLRKRLEDTRVKEWFSDKWKIYNECTIISKTAKGEVKERRPDRVMSDGKNIIVVDFKFGHPQEKHHEQVKEYILLLQQMGHKNVKGYLWYVYNNRIEEV